MLELKDDIKPELMLPQIGERKVHVAQRYLSNCWDGPLEAAKWVIDGVIPEGLTVISGQSGAGKTTALPGLAAAAAGFLHARHPLQGPKNVRRQVVIVTEYQTQLVRLFAAAEARGDLLEGWRDYIRLVQARKEKPDVWMEPLDMSGLITTCQADGVVVNKGPLFIIDTMGYAFDLEDENSNDEIFKLIAGLKEAWGEDVSTWLVTHTAKGRDNEEPRGASAKRDAADHTLAITTDKDEKRFLKIKKTKYAHEETIFALKLYAHPMEVQNEFLQMETEVIQVSFAEPATQEEKEKGAKGSADVQKEILSLLEEGEMNTKAIREGLKIAHDKVRKALDSLVKRGKVATRKEGKSNLYSLSDPF